MKFHQFLPLFILLYTFCLPSQLPAQVLLDFGFDNGGSDIVESTTVPWDEPTAIFGSNVQGWSGATDGLTIGSGLTSGGTGADQYRVVQTAAAYPTSLADAMSNDVYLSFTVAPDSGFNLDLSNLEIDFSGGGGLGSRPDQGSLFSSVDGFASTTDVIETQFVNQTNNIFDLSDAKFDAVGTTEFRVYLWRGDGTSVTGGSVFFLHSPPTDERWTLNGSAVPVPEATTMSLFALAGVGLFCLPRRRRTLQAAG